MNMVHGQWADTLNKKRPVIHFHAESRQVSFGPTLCGRRVRPTSNSETTNRVDGVTCKDCKRKLA